MCEVFFVSEEVAWLLLLLGMRWISTVEKLENLLQSRNRDAIKNN